MTTTQTPGVGATDAAEAADRGITAPRVPQPPVTPQQRRQQLANALDAQRNAAALGAARSACLAPAVDRLVPVLVGGHEFYVKGERAAAVRPYVAERRAS